MVNKSKLKVSREVAIPEILNKIGAKEAVEVGVFKAQFSKHLLKNWDGTLWLVDPWRAFEEGEGYVDASNHKKHQTAYLEAMQNIEGYESRAFMLRGLSSDMASRFEDNSLDLVYLDGNHAYEWVKEDIELWWPKIKKGGVLTGHDYLDMDWKEGMWADNGKDKHIWMTGSEHKKHIYAGLFGVNPAVDEFAEVNNLTMVLTNEWLGTWIIEK
tara:strand:- start:1515 stop:2153 length:639 start_codon:yes stop_codon:yes gene_type:complete